MRSVLIALVLSFAISACAGVPAVRQAEEAEAITAGTGGEPDPGPGEEPDPEPEGGPCSSTQVPSTSAPMLSLALLGLLGLLRRRRD